MRRGGHTNLVSSWGGHQVFLILLDNLADSPFAQIVNGPQARLDSSNQQIADHSPCTIYKTQLMALLPSESL